VLRLVLLSSENRGIVLLWNSVIICQPIGRNVSEDAYLHQQRCENLFPAKLLTLQQQMFFILFTSSSCIPHASSLSSFWFDDANNIRRGVPIMKLLTAQFSPASCYFLPLGFKYLLPERHLSKHPQPYSFNVKDQVSHPRRTTRKGVFLGDIYRNCVVWIRYVILSGITGFV
jgi:hypothetical protein